MKIIGNRKLIAFFTSIFVFFVLGILAILYVGKENFPFLNTIIPAIGAGVMLIAGPFFIANAAVHAKGKAENKEI